MIGILLFVFCVIVFLMKSKKNDKQMLFDHKTDEMMRVYYGDEYKDLVSDKLPKHLRAEGRKMKREARRIVKAAM
jgi:hypothetical protein